VISGFAVVVVDVFVVDVTVVEVWVIVELVTVVPEDVVVVLSGVVMVDVSVVEGVVVAVVDSVELNVDSKVDVSVVVAVLVAVLVMVVGKVELAVETGVVDSVDAAVLVAVVDMVNVAVEIFVNVAVVVTVVVGAWVGPGGPMISCSRLILLAISSGVKRLASTRQSLDPSLHSPVSMAHFRIGFAISPTEIASGGDREYKALHLIDLISSEMHLVHARVSKSQTSSVPQRILPHLSPSPPRVLHVGMRSNASFPAASTVSLRSSLHLLRVSSGWK